jgi:hypothetical protein
VRRERLAGRYVKKENISPPTDIRKKRIVPSPFLPIKHLNKDLLLKLCRVQYFRIRHIFPTPLHSKMF